MPWSSRKAFCAVWNTARRCTSLETIARLAQHFTELVRAITLHPQQPLAALDMVTVEEKAQIIYGFGDVGVSMLLLKQEAYSILMWKNRPSLYQIMWRWCTRNNN
ncbi:hypothetical protein [Paenibacillus sp. FSL L8-0644]|uniref:hypothetical protein n=1 Tax=Paenibacillus sp. FSL L8-0644 TaxID=2954523 RepID=UPI004046EDD1